MKKIFSLFSVLVFISVTGLYSQISKEDLKKIDLVITKAFDTFKPTGLSVAIVKDSLIVFHKAFGFSNADVGKSVNTTSLFNIASCSKAFTAACIGILVDEKKLKWTDKVISYFPEFKLADDYITKELTVEDLLCHRSGLGTFYGDLMWYNCDYTDAEVMKRMRNEPITRRFGIEFGYQNIMFMIAGDLIEKVTGQTWSQFVQSRIFTPLAMTESRPSSDELNSSQDIAFGHMNNKKLDLLKFVAGKPAASIYSSVDELSKWTILMNHNGVYGGKRIISSASVNRILEPHTILGASSSMKQNGTNFYMYGMGWFLYDYYGRKVAEHDGGMPGYISKVTIIPAEKISVIILNNGNDGYISTVIKNDVLEILTKSKDVDWVTLYSGYKSQSDTSDEKAKKARLDSRIPDTRLSLAPDGYTGLFRDKSYGDAEVKLTDGKLILTFLPSKNALTGELEHWHYNTFKVTFKDPFLEYGLVTFDFDSSGKTTGFKIDLPSGDFHFWNLDFKKVKQ
jgi:CubicO group peptidase (beta-lactamase class C family)